MKKVLFLCTGNSTRNQMAEGLLRYFADEKFDAYSAGVNPTQIIKMSQCPYGLPISYMREYKSL